MDIFHHLKFLNWCAKNYFNYIKYFSSNFSSLVWKYFAPKLQYNRSEICPFQSGNYRSEKFPHQRRKVTVPLYGSKIVYSSGRAAANDSYGRWFVSRWRLFYSSSPKIGAKKFAPKFRREKFPFSSENYGREIFLYLCGFHSYISLLVWKLFISFGTVHTVIH